MDAMIVGLLWFSILASALIAGLYFAFSAFIMTALRRVGQVSGITAMNAINADIQRSLFMPLFLGSTLSAAILAIAAVLRWGEPASPAMLAGGLLYVLGMFVVTMIWNVPRNNRLAAVEPSGTDAATVWESYSIEWTFWNHVRTVASLAALTLFIVALMQGPASG